MRLASIVVTIVLVMLCRTCAAQTARDCYDELYKASGLDRMSDGFVGSSDVRVMPFEEQAKSLESEC
jgi:hypothetical protein